MDWFDRLLCKLKGHHWFVSPFENERICARCRKLEQTSNGVDWLPAVSGKYNKGVAEYGRKCFDRRMGFKSNGD